MRGLNLFVFGTIPLTMALAQNFLEKPVIGGCTSFPNQKAELNWIHPLAYQFSIARVESGKTNVFTTLFFNGCKQQGLHVFKHKIKLEPGLNRFRVRAEIEPMKSDWSDEIAITAN